MSAPEQTTTERWQLDYRRGPNHLVPDEAGRGWRSLRSFTTEEAAVAWLERSRSNARGTFEYRLRYFKTTERVLAL